MSVAHPPRRAAPVSRALRVLAISPHLDDAVYSAGATLATLVAHGHRVTLVTTFAGGRPGDPNSAEVMSMRRVEDMQAAARLGVQRLVHLPFPEAQHRGYDDVFGALREDDDVAPDLRAAIATLGEYELVLAPTALGEHVDHRQLSRALGLHARVDDPSPVGRRRRGGLALWRDTPHVLSGEDPPTPGDDAVVMSGDALQRKLSACACYSTTLGRVFGGEGRMREQVSDLAFAEGSRHGRPAPAESFAPASPVMDALRPQPQAA